jgi:hypothetical protein
MIEKISKQQKFFYRKLIRGIPRNGQAAVTTPINPHTTEPRPFLAIDIGYGPTRFRVRRQHSSLQEALNIRRGE